MTNAGPAILDRIIRQNLSPQYISVHVTDYEIRRKLMGLRKDDFILEKIRRLHDNGITMHTQIVLCPGINDGEALARTVADLYRFREQIVSLAVVPVGLTDHRFGLSSLKRVDAPYAAGILDTVGAWHERFRGEIGRGFIYPSDEFFLVAGRPIPAAPFYDSFPQIENGVGLVRTFLDRFRRQSRNLPRRLASPRRVSLVTGTLASGLIGTDIVPRLARIDGLEVTLHTAPNTLFGDSVTVAGLLSGKCVYSALQGKDRGDLVLLPPDILNADGLFLDDMSVSDLEKQLGTPVLVHSGRWADLFSALNQS
jgi:putative radical SAM enzyme (TIGR03279 family)